MRSLFLLAVIGLASCAPQWPYRDSMQPYYYGYPGQTPYVYRPQIEDDEGDDIPTGRQDLPVVSSSQDNIGNPQQQVQQQQLNPVPLNIENNPVVVETGSAAPVIPQQSQLPQKNQQPLNAQTPPNVNNPNAQREPPPFPPATTPRPPKPDEDDSEEDEDEDEDADADTDADAEADDEEQGDNSEESEEEEDRRRQEPIKVMSEEVTTTEPPPPAPVVVNETVSSSVEDVEEVVKDIHNVKKHPIRIEALVPGYVTDQGEVLVPVDTVTGDQPISIVPDPYTPPARGIPANQFGESPYFYAETLRRNHPIRRTHFRQEEAEDSEEEEEAEEAEDEENSDEEEEDEKQEERVPLAAIPARAPSNEDDERDSTAVHGSAKARNENLNAFPTSRTPQLFAVINSKIPVNQQFLNKHYGQSQRRNPYYGFLAGQNRPIAYGSSGIYGGQLSQGFAPRYPQNQQVYSRIIYKNQNQAYPNYAPNYFSTPSYYSEPQQQSYPVRRRNPIASVEFSLESEEDDHYNSPYNFNRPSFNPNFNRFRPQQKIIYRRRPGTDTQVKRPTFINKQKKPARPVKPVKPVKSSANNAVNRKKVVNNNQPNIGLLAVYNLGDSQKYNGVPSAVPLQFIRRRPTPVIKQDDIVDDISAVSSQQQDFEPNYEYYDSPEILRLSRRDAKQIKRKKEGSGKKVNSSDPLGLLGKIHNRKY